MNNNPKVSFLVPTYNYARYMRECVSSILSQTHQNLEIWILDDASQDDSPAVGAALMAEDSRVHYYRHPSNIGPVANWNSCLEKVTGEKATGDFVWLISADDCLASPDTLARLLSRFELNPSLGFVFCRAQIMNEHSELIEKWIPHPKSPYVADTPTFYQGQTLFRQLIQANFVPVMGVLARQQCYAKAGGFPADLIHCGDWYHWLRFSLHWDVFFEPEALVWYRLHSTNLSRSYENAAYVGENTLLCYARIRDYIWENHLPASLLKAVDVAEIKLRKHKKLPRTWGDRLAYRLLQWTGQ